MGADDDREHFEDYREQTRVKHERMLTVAFLSSQLNKV